MPRHSPDRLHSEKGGWFAAERDEFARAAWRVMVAAAVEPERLLFVDECGLHTSLAPIYGYAPRGERLCLSVPRSRGKNTTLLSSMTASGMGPSLRPWKGDRRPGLRDPRREGARAEPPYGTDRGDGRPRST